MTRWEYTTAAPTDLPELGRDGWELVTAVYDTEHLRHVAYLRRPLTAPGATP